MVFRHHLPFIVSLSINILLTGVARCEPPATDSPKPRTDIYGEPLPAGAIARLGSERFRHDFSVTCLAISADGKMLATSSRDGTVRLWDAYTGRGIRFFQNPKWMMCVTFSPDSNLVAAAGWDGIARLWETATGKEILQFKGQGGMIRSVSFSPDGKTLASASDDNTVLLWDVDSGKEIRRLNGHGQCVNSVAFSPDGKLLASASHDRSVRLWDPATGEEIRQIEGHDEIVRSVAFSPDGRLLVSAGLDRSVRLWEVSSGKEVRQLQGHKGEIWSAAFSRDGKLIASASEDETVRLWEVFTGQEIGNFQGQQGSAVHSVVFCPDGRTLASAGAGNKGSGFVWLLGEVCRKRELPATALDTKQLEALWTDLGSDSAAKAYEAVGTLVDGAKEAVPFLQSQLQSAAPDVDPQRIARLIKDLDDDRYAVREAATTELKELGELARPALQKLLAGQPSPEAQWRVENLLKRLPGPPPQHLRIHRAVMVLEQIGNPEAKELLETLSKGVEGALLTEEAKAACRRMKP